MDKIKILFCTNAFRKITNGPAKFANLLLKESKTISGLEIRILTEDVESTYVDIYKLDLYIPKILKPFSQFIRMYKYHSAAMRIRRTYNFDALVYNNAIVGLLSVLLFENTFGFINDYTLATSVSDRKGTEYEKRLKIFTFKIVEKFYCKCAKKPVIVNSGFLANTLSKEYKSPVDKFRILYPGVDNFLIRNFSRSLINNKIPKSILFVKTNFHLAGFWILADAIIKLQIPVNLTVVGPPKRFHENIKTFFLNSNVSLSLHSYLSPDEVYRLMQSSKIFCLPAFKESFGIVNLEALASGCIVVTTNTGGIPEAVGNDRFAYLVPPGDVNSLAEALKKALNNNDYHLKLEELNNHLMAFSSSNMVKKFRDIIKEELNSPIIED